MINDQSNMGRKQIFDELPVPSKLKEFKNELIYKGIFIIAKLLLDIRSNLILISQGKVIKPKGKYKTYPKKTKKPDNAIKGLDTIKIDTKTTKDKDIPSSKEKPDHITLGEPEKDKENEKTS